MARRQEAKDRYIQNQKEDLSLARRTAYAHRKDKQTNSIKIADINSEYEKIQKESTSKYYTITDPELKPAAAAGSKEVKEEEDEAVLSLLPLTNDDKNKEKLKEIAIHATASATANGDDTNEKDSNKNNLDIYTYHRGRTGQEPRNIHGDLLCDTNPIDTNFNWNPPKTFVCKITVKFPLGDINEDEYEDSDLDDDDDDKNKKDGGVDGCSGDGGDKSTSGGGELNLDNFEIKGSSSFKESAIEAAQRASRSRLSRGGQQEIWDQKQNGQSSTLASAAEDSLPHFVETVQWDLANPKTPSPEEYATNIATEWGLTFPQTMALKDSIEKQLEAFCNSQNKFYAPIAVVDPYGSERPSAHYGPPESHCGPVLSTGGSARPTIRRAGGATMSGASRKSRPSGQVKPNPRGGIHVVPQEQVEKPNKKGDACCAEILKRIKQHSKNIVAECVSEGKATLQVVKNDVCHVCHNRKECGLTFHCGRHSFCEYHVATRLSFLVGYYDSKNPTVSLLIVLCCLVSLHSLF